jgi:putative radical SAM enzyme (TIGR03279 family)
MAAEVYGRISGVTDDSPASKAGIRVGDEIVSISGRPVRDVLEYRFLSAEERLEVEVCRGGMRQSFRIVKSAHEDLGLDFEEDLFDGLRACRNDCTFCFLRQMPKGLRESLYVRDDDFRLSLAHGNYVTLTDLSDDDMERICSQRMSPIYVSVHATEPDLRASMLRNKNAGRIMEQLRCLADARITVHAQIVICPGVNDGPHLERSIRDLSTLHPWVASVALVPVGLTKHREGLAALRPVDEHLARDIVRACARWQREFRRTLGTRFVFASDELYLLSGRRFPSCEAYEGFPQLEDGVGISRIFLDELRQLSRRSAGRSLRSGRYVLVTGVLAAPMVQKLADLMSESAGIKARVCTVVNRFLGETVTVAGLLTGRDIADALAGMDRDEEILVPSVALNEDRFLDDMTLSDLQEVVGRRVTAVPAGPRGVFRMLSEA